MGFHDCFQTIEPSVPLISVPIDPPPRVIQARRPESAFTDAALLFRGYQPGLLEDRYMLLESCESHAYGFGQFGDGRAPATQPLEDLSPSWIRQGREGPVECPLRLNHMVQYIELERCFSPRAGATSATPTGP